MANVREKMDVPTGQIEASKDAERKQTKRSEEMKEERQMRLLADRALDIRGCVRLILTLRLNLDGVFLPFNNKLRMFGEKFNSKFWWRHLH